MSRKHKGGKARRARRGGMTRRHGVRTTNIFIEKSRFPSLPKEFEISLKYFYHDERSDRTAQSARVQPLLEFNTVLPRYAPELYQIYRHARIMAVDVKMEIVNLSSTEPLIAAIGVLPLANANALTNPQTIASVPGTVFKQVGNSSGMSRQVLSRRCTSEKELGEITAGSNVYLQTYSEALSSAVWTELPAVYSAVIAAKNGATWSGIVDYVYTFHMRFSELNIPSLGFPLTQQPPLIRRKAMIEKRDISENPEEDEIGEWADASILEKARAIQARGKFQR